jgi:thymidylate synthase
MKNVHLNIDHALDHVIARVYHDGIESSPRGMKVLELLGQSVTFDMRFPLVTRKARELGYRFAPAEAAWILSGRNDMQFFQDLDMPFIWQFSDDGHFYQGAYGPRIVDQLSYVCDVLSDDHDTRQAVIEVWRPNPRPSRDIPCTLTYQFVARDGMLNCIQSMRSSDVWLGYAYDAFNAAMLTGYVILLLRERKERGRKDLRVGHHTMFVGSQHLYERNFEKARAYLADQTSLFAQPEFKTDDFASPGELIDHLTKLALRSWIQLDDDGYLVDQLMRVHFGETKK